MCVCVYKSQYKIINKDNKVSKIYFPPSTPGTSASNDTMRGSRLLYVMNTVWINEWSTITHTQTMY